ncbi:hypothetical protein F5051DRAFT_445085 [Lentinula edodes]|nr:hypothetical protein F5051DRAFT_445085 [Lentinula edodes]
MNFISHRAAYSLFPRTTFKDKATLILDNGYTSAGSSAGVEKYVRRGLKVMKAPSVARILDPTSDVVAVSPRFVNDSRTWRVPIKYHGRTKPQPDFAEANSFEMVYQGDMNKILWMVITGPELVHTYIAAPSDWGFMKSSLSAIQDLMEDGILQRDVGMLTFQRLNPSRRTTYVWDDVALNVTRKVAQTLAFSAAGVYNIHQFLREVRVAHPGMTVSTAMITSGRRREEAVKIVVNIPYRKGLQIDMCRFNRWMDILDDEGVILQLEWTEGKH